MANRRKKFSRRTTALFIMLGIAILFGVLIAYEQISVLYIVASLSLVVLLVIVAFSDLESVGRVEGDGTRP